MEAIGGLDAQQLDTCMLQLLLHESGALPFLVLGCCGACCAKFPSRPGLEHVACLPVQVGMWQATGGGYAHYNIRGRPLQGGLLTPNLHARGKPCSAVLASYCGTCCAQPGTAWLALLQDCSAAAKSSCSHASFSM